MRSHQQPRRPSERRWQRVAEALEDRRLLSLQTADLGALAGALSSFVSAFTSSLDDHQAIHAKGLDFAGTSGTELNPRVAAFFTRGDVSNVTATIDWGDGTTPTDGTLSPLPFANAIFGGGTVSGKHTYAQDGTYAVKVTITDKAGDTASAQANGSIGQETITPRGIDLGAFPGTPTGPVAVASFTDSLGLLPADGFKATIDWGDGTTPTAGHVVVRPDQIGATGDTSQPITPQYAVIGEHTYATDGSYKVHVTVAGLGGASASVDSAATVNEIVARGQDFTATTGIDDHDRPIASFKVADPAATADQFTATIDWGDGTTPTTGTITRAGDDGGDGSLSPGRDGHWTQAPDVSRFVVTSDHLYSKAGTYGVQVTITDNSGHKATVKDSATVTDEALSAKGIDVAAVAGRSTGAFPVAALRDSLADIDGSLTATVDWGDGTDPTTGHVVHRGDFQGDDHDHGGLMVAGEHTYATAGTYTIHVTVQSTTGVTANAMSTATVTAAAPLHGQGLPLFASAGTAFSGVPLAVFPAPTPTPDAGDVGAKIDWGDGTTPSEGTVAIQQGPGHGDNGGGGSVLVVLGGHTYAQAGRFTVHVTITLKDGTTGTAETHAIVLGSLPPPPSAPTDGTPTAVVVTPPPAPPATEPGSTGASGAAAAVTPPAVTPVKGQDSVHNNHAPKGPHGHLLAGRRNRRKH
jgi:PKD repeat protein